MVYSELILSDVSLNRGNWAFIFRYPPPIITPAAVPDGIAATCLRNPIGQEQSKGARLRESSLDGNL